MGKLSIFGKSTIISKIVLSILIIAIVCGGVFTVLNFSELQELWAKFTDFMDITISLIVMFAGLAGIAVVIVFSLRLINKKGKAEDTEKDGKSDNAWQTAVLIMCTILSCLCMIPTIAGFNSYTLKKVKQNKIKELNAEIENYRLKKENLEKDIALKEKTNKVLEKEKELYKKNIEIETLEESLRILKNTQLNMKSFQEICKVALLETDLKQTIVNKKRLSDVETGKIFFWENGHKYYEEGLAIDTYKFKALFGFDFKDIKIDTPEYSNTVYISGIKPKQIGIDEYTHNSELAEIRKIDVSKSGGEVAQILNDKDRKDKAVKFSQECEKEYHNRLNEGVQTNFMNTAVEKLAQKFIELILTPMGKKVVFIKGSSSTAIPLETYLEIGLKETQNKIDEINKNNHQNTEKTSETKEQPKEKDNTTP